MDGRAAQSRQRAAGDLAQRQSVRRHHVSAGCRQQRASDRRRLGAGPDEQRAAVGDHPAQGHVGDPSEPFAQRRVRRISRFSPICWAAPTRAPKIHGSYIREAYQNGLAMQDARGYNPYKFGVVGASDSHDTAVAYTQSNYFGGHGLLDATPQARLSGKETAGAD